MENECLELKHFQSELRKQDELLRLVELRLTELERRLALIDYRVLATAHTFPLGEIS